MASKLKCYQHISESFPGIVTGLSDHMPDSISVLAAVTLGARVIEKHFTDSTQREGPDHSFSMLPASFSEMVNMTRNLELSLGDGIKRIEENEKETVVMQRRSICLTNNKRKGDVLDISDLSVLRPCDADSIPPFEIEKVLGMSLKREMSAGEPIKWGDLA